MLTFLTKGSVKIKKTVNGSEITASFSVFKTRNVEIELDIKNSGKINRNGTPLDDIKGGWLNFDLELVDPPNEAGGNDGDSILNLMNILAACIQSTTKEEQTLKVCIGYNAQDTVYYECILNGKIKLSDLSAFIGTGQAITLPLRTRTRSRSLLPLPYYDDTATAGYGIDAYGTLGYGS